MGIILGAINIITGGVSLIFTSALSYIVDHMFTWLKLIFTFFLIDSIFRAFLLTGYLTGLSEFIIYMENKGIYPLMPEIGVTWVTNIFTLWLSLTILEVVFGTYSSEVVTKPQLQDETSLLKRQFTNAGWFGPKE